MSETRDFHIGDVLSAATGRLVSPDHIGGVYNILNWMTGENLMTHQLPRASRECEPTLRAWYSELCSVEFPPISSWDDCDAFLQTLYPKFGTHVPVPKLADIEHTVIDPIAELKMLRPDAQIIAVEVSGD